MAWWMAIPALASAGASIFGAAKGSKASKDAAKAQERQMQQALALRRQLFGYLGGQAEPWMAFGRETMRPMAEMANRSYQAPSVLGRGGPMRGGPPPGGGIRVPPGGFGGPPSVTLADIARDSEQQRREQISRMMSVGQDLVQRRLRGRR